jgi:DNA-binding winged helix-turn-helix (wHTH) protein
MVRTGHYEVFAALRGISGFFLGEMRLSFGEYTVDLDARELLRGEDRVHLSPKAFRLLELLVRQRPRALSKQELQDALWPDTFVVESNLADAASEVRRALGQAGQRSGFVRTVHGFGYAFSAAAQEEAEKPSPLCRLAWEGGQAVLGEGEFLLGRDPAAAVQVETSTVSWSHARIRIKRSAGQTHATIEDLASKNGTYLGGRKLAAPAELHDRDEVRLGSARLSVTIVGTVRRETDTAAASTEDGVCAPQKARAARPRGKPPRR